MKGFYVPLTAIIKKHGGYKLRNGKGDHEIWVCNGEQEVIDRGINTRFVALNILKDLKLKERLQQQLLRFGQWSFVFVRFLIAECSNPLYKGYWTRSL